MIQTAEQLIETIRALSPSERKKFFDMAETEKQKGHSENGSKIVEVPERIDRFNMALKWIHDNKEKYDGQWVCLYGDQLIAHGMDGLKVFEEAKTKGIKSPFIERIKAEVLPFGGW
jgi:hypothetical protein